MRVMHKSLEYSKDLVYSVGLPTEPPVGSDMTSWNLEGGIWQEASISVELLPFSLLLSLPPLTVFLPAGGCFGNLRTFFFFFFPHKRWCCFLLQGTGAVHSFSSLSLWGSSWKCFKTRTWSDCAAILLWEACDGCQTCYTAMNDSHSSWSTAGST